MIFAMLGNLRATAPSTRWASDDLVVVADANIDNLDELRAAGLSIGAEPSAAEIIAAAYARWGTRCAGHLLGDFAFVVEDRTRHRLVCGRDHLGVRPLYYTETAGGFTVGSVARDVAGDRAAPNALAVSLFILRAHDESTVTLLEGVSAVQPGHVVVVDERGVRSERYWELDTTARENDSIEQRFAAVFREAVACRIGTAPVAVTVSGGLDSSAVASQAAAVREATEGPAPHSFHLSIPGLSCDEGPYCDAVVNKWRLPDFRANALEVEMAYAPEDHPDLLIDPTVRSFDPLFAEAHRRGIPTMLTGIGGDHTMDESRHDIADAVRDGRVADAATMAGIRREPWSLAGYRWLVQAGLRPLTPEPVRRFARRFRAVRPQTPLSAWATKEARAHLEDQMRREYERGARPRAMARDLAGPGFYRQVQQANRLGERWGVRVRHPFLDVRVVELMASAPARVRLRNGIFKHKPVLRRALRHLLPPQVAQRRDISEFSDYLRYTLVTKGTKSLFAESRLADLGIIDRRSIRAVLEGSTQTHINRLATTTAMELWLRRTWS